MENSAITGSDPALRVLIVAGRLGLDSDGWPIAPLLERLESRGMAVQVLCLDRKSEPELVGQIIERPSLGYPWLRWFSMLPLMADGRLLRPDLIHLIHDDLSEVALALADRWQVPYVVSIDDYETLEHGLRIGSRWCRSFVVGGHDLAQSLHRELGVPERLITVVLPGVLSTARPPKAFESDRIPVIGTAGLSVESSGVHIFFEAARIVLGEGRDTEFIVSLQGEDELDLRRLAQRMGIGDRITIADFSFLGDRFWSVLDVYCQPSLSRSVGRTLTLAMAHAVPCVATDIPGIHDLINHGQSGLLVPRGDPKFLALAILSLLDDRKTARFLASNAANFIRDHFNPETEADQLAVLYRKLVIEPV